MEDRDSTRGVADLGGGIHFQKQQPDGVLNLPKTLYSRVLKRRHQLTIELQIRSCCGTVDQVSTLVLRITFLLSADYVVLLVSSDSDPQQALRWLAA